jgi:hypothetical protein
MEMAKIHMNAQGCRKLERATTPKGKTAKGSHPIDLGVWVGLSDFMLLVSFQDIWERAWSGLF